MQLKIQRSQRDGGLISKTAIFCLDARAEFTAQEQDSISRYKLGGEVIYNSEASRRLLEKSERQQDGSTRGALKSLVSTGLAAMRLNITISSLARGKHIECKSLDELRGAEAALMDACTSLKDYLDTAATFDGRTVLISFDGEAGPHVIAQATPQKVIAPPAASLPEGEPLAIEHQLPSPYASLVGTEPASEYTSGTATHSGPDLSQTLQQLNDLITPPNILIAVGVFLLILMLKACG
jgi:hypothetical protein